MQVQIRDHILSGKIKEAEKVINSAYPELLDDNHLLHFYLQLQHLIELVREKKIEEAVNFAQEDIVEKEWHLSQKVFIVHISFWHCCRKFP